LTLSADSWVDDDDAIDEKEEEEEADSARDTNGLGPTKAQDACDCKTTNSSEAITREFIVSVIAIAIVLLTSCNDE
jgi:hypothetical protein